MKENKFNDIQKIQFYFGIILFVIFLATGQYLKWVIKPEYLLQIDQRMMARANHIYILFVSLLNILGSLVEFDAREKWKSHFGITSRIVLMIAGIIYTCIFFQNYGSTLSDRKIILLPTILVLVGVILSVCKVFSSSKKHS